jgi:glycosyltransferase involved in cell wall biosynthesis
VSDGECNEARYEDALRQLGSTVICGFPAAVEHLAATGYEYRWALLSRPEQALRYLAAVRAYAPHATVIYDTVDLHWTRMQRQAEVTGDAAAREEADRFRRMERVAITCSDVVFAITAQERDAVLVEVPGARVEVIPNVHSCRPSSLPWTERKDLMFIGGFEHTPNVDAVRWFIDRIMPLVQRELPGTVLHVVGSKAPDEVKRLASNTVHVAGYVPDPEPYFEGCRVFVSPLRFGAGMKGKIGQSMGFGLPVVTTTIGAEGLFLLDGENALVADTPEAFSQAIVRLYSDPLLWAKVSRNALRHIQERFSSEAVRGRLESIFSDADAPPRTEHGLVERGTAA